MKMWSRLCFLVLVVSSVSGGQEEQSHKDPTPTPLTAESEKRDHTTLPNVTQTSVNGTALPSGSSTSQEAQNTVTHHSGNKMKGTSGGTVADTTFGNVTGSTSNVTSAETTTSNPATDKDTSTPSWAYVMLVIIILIIIALCVILYFLRRISRTYSFDLHRPAPVSHLDEPMGTFEPVYQDDLDRPAPKDQATSDDLSPPLVANGTSLQLEEKGSCGESAPQGHPDANSMESSPLGNTSPSLGDDASDKTPSPLSSTNLFFDATGEEQHNENNNHPAASSSDPFVEINLDDPAWCDQLFPSPDGSSSVHPFSPFSLPS